MLRLPLSALVCLAVVGACQPPAEASTPDAPLPATMAPGASVDATGPVVVELFTSEGCSSCPPADRLLAELDERVVALAYHVDYWDRLGWADPYGDAAYSARQRAYAGTLDGRVCTPQMVVGGTRGVVGSGATAARAAIEAAPALRVPVRLEARLDGRAVVVGAAAPDAPDGAVLHLAIVQRTASSDVRRGENGGRRLDHVRVVRALETVETPPGTARLPLPDGLDASEVCVEALVQRGRVGPIAGAAEGRVEV